jgi:hypothetical protein
MWARVKGKTENALLRLPFKAAFMFRPGYIQPLRGIRSKTRCIKRSTTQSDPSIRSCVGSFRSIVTTTTNIGRAMIHVAVSGWSRQILSSGDINQLSS